MTSGDNPRSLVAALRAAGPVPVACSAALQTVPRELFIPSRMWVQELEDGPYQPIDRAKEPERWLRMVYSDRVIVTQFDDGDTIWPDIGERPTCSASMPSVVVGMLAALDVQLGHLVLEIGTGTGWNAALLGSIVGSKGKVTTVEIDGRLGAMARKRLDSVGCENVNVLIGDGAAANVAPRVLHRVIATAGVHIGHLPWSWVQRTRKGGIVLAPMRADMASGPLVRFVVSDDGSATGHAVDLSVGFMELRSQRVASDPVGDQRWDDPSADVTYSDLAPWIPLQALDDKWPIAVAVPSCRVNVWERTPDRPHGVAWLRDPLSGSWASVIPDNGRYLVRQHGPRRLWDEAETAYRWWQRRGKPPLSAWCWTVTQDRQSITLDN